MGLTSAWQQAVCVSGIFGSLVFFYAYSFYMGNKLLLDPEVMNGDKRYSGGDICTCIFGIFFGAFSFGMCLPNFKAVFEGLIAGKKIYDMILR